MTLREALQGDIPCLKYPENRKQYDLAVVNRRTGKYYIGKIREDGSFKFPAESEMRHEGTLDLMMDSEVYNWADNDRAMLIVL